MTGSFYQRCLIYLIERHASSSGVGSMPEYRVWYRQLKSVDDGSLGGQPEAGDHNLLL